MEDNNKSMTINATSRHRNLTNANVANVWSVDITNGINEKEQSNLEQLERHAQSMFNGKAGLNRELYKHIKQRLKIESNKAMTAFNKPTKSLKRQSRRRMTRRHRRAN